MATAPAAARAVYSEGPRERPRPVALRFAATLELIEAGIVAERWAYARIARIAAPPGRHRFAQKDGPQGAFLEVEDAAAAAELDRVCARVGKEGGRRGLIVLVALTVAPLLLVLLLVMMAVPWLAGRAAMAVPPEFETALGNIVDGQIRASIPGRVCRTPASEAALRALVGRIAGAGGVHLPVTAVIIDNPTPNALALPGGRVYVLRGLIDRAGAPDELAGVIAHEIGHVAGRHGLRKLFQSGGVAFLLGFMFGDVVGSGAAIVAARGLLDSSYSRDAEFEADAYAGRVMTGLGRSAIAMAQLLDRVEGGAGSSMPTLLRSHPLTADRLARLRALEKPATGTALLDDAAWQALKRACAG